MATVKFPLVLLGLAFAATPTPFLHVDGLYASEGSTDFCPGLFVESIENRLPEVPFVLREGDILLSWRTEGDQRDQGTFCWPQDWIEFDVEHQAKANVRLSGFRDGLPFSVLSEGGEWKITIRPHFSGQDLQDYLTASQFLTKNHVRDAVSVLSAAAERAANTAREQIAIWLLRKVRDLHVRERNWNDAIEACNAALVLALRKNDPLLIAEIRYIKGITLADGGRLDAAADEFQEALRIRKTFLPASPAVARVLHRLGQTAYRRGLLHEADSLYREALEIRQKKSPRTLLFAETLQGLANVALQRGDLDTAEASNLQALSLRRALNPESEAVARSLGTLGQVALQRGDLNKALELNQEALAILEKTKSGDPDHATALLILGDIEFRKGEFLSAERRYRQAKSILEHIDPMHSNLANVLDNLGLLAHKREDMSTAQDFFQAALRIKERLAPDSLSVAGSLHYLGSVAMNRNDLDTAETLFRRALTIREQKAPGSLAVAYSLTSLAHIAGKRRDFVTAERLHRQALALQRTVAPDGLDVASSLYNLGLTLHAVGRIEEARVVLAEATSIRSRIAPDSSAEAEALYMLGIVTWALGQKQEAAQSINHALSSLEVQTSRLGGSQEARSNFVSMSTHGYREYINLLLELGRTEEAFDVSERSRGQVFREMLREGDVLGSPSLPAEIIKDRERISSKQDRIWARLQELKGRQDSRVETARLESEMRALREEKAALSDQVRYLFPSKIDSWMIPPKRLQEIKAALEPGTLLMSYSVGPQSTVLFLLDHKTGLRLAPVPAGEADLRAKISLFRRLLTHPANHPNRASTLRSMGSEIYRLLFGPAEREIARSRRILILPDGPLHVLPFAALCREQSGLACEYLTERKPFVVDQSATIHSGLMGFRRQRPTSPSVVAFSGFGDPDYPPSPNREASEATLSRGMALDRLSHSRTEVQRIADLFPGSGELYLGERATEERAKSLPPGHRYIHFACHGLLDSEFPLNSGLALSIPGHTVQRKETGVLQAWEIFEQLRLNADLVVLSACETGLGKEMGGEGLIGLTRAFQYAGARSVMASLWKISDRTTAEFMVRFYRHLKEGLTKDEALRATQMEFIRGPIQVTNDKGERVEFDASAPYYWAAFQIYGDWQ